MIIRLRTHVRGSKFYDPPVKTDLFYSDEEFALAIAQGRVPQAIESNIPFVTFLVSRFLFQFPWLENEADELFSIGIIEYAQVIRDHEKYNGKSLRAVSMVKAQRKIEEYASGIGCLISCSLTTRYKNVKVGKREAKTTSIQ